MLTAKLAHGLYHHATVVDCNLFIKFLKLGMKSIQLAQDCKRLKLIVFQ